MSGNRQQGACVAYDEEVFSHFLEMERVRAERAGRSLLLLLVDLRFEGEADRRIDEATAEVLVTALCTCIRENDFVGWQRTQRTLGAVLTQGASAPTVVDSQQIGERVTKVVSDHLPPRLRARVEVRVLQLMVPLRSRHA